MNEYEESLVFLDQAISLIGSKPHTLRPQIVRIRFDVLKLQGEILKAQQTLETQTEIMPEHPDAWFLLAMHKMQNFNAMFHEVVDLVLKSKNTAISYRGSAGFESSLATWKSDLQLANLQLMTGNVIEARRLFASVVAENPYLVDAKQRLEHLDNQICELAKEIMPELQTLSN